MARKSAPRQDNDEERVSTHDIWKGSITFGLVDIPVALVSAENSSGLSLSYLDRRDFSPVGYRRYNKSNDKDVPWSEIVHGYEYAKGEYVVLGKSDLKRANPTKRGEGLRRFDFMAQTKFGAVDAGESGKKASGRIERGGV